MNDALVLVTILSAAAILSVVAKRLKIPYPITFVFGGIVLAFSRHLPRPYLDPHFILLVVLPPLLYSAALNAGWQDLKRNWQPISLMAIGLVMFTTLVVAVFAHYLIPDFPWPVAFVLGAIVSPPDAVAAEAVFERLAIPSRIAAIVSGECLVNDATALVLYRFAVLAAVAGVFHPGRAAIDFFLVAGGGIAIGVAVAFAIEGVLRYITRHGFDDSAIASVVFLIAPYASYLPAEWLHVSGVLAAVTAGIVLARRSTHFVDSETRIIGSSVWKLLTFLLNAYVFLLIGTQLPWVVADITNLQSYIVYGLLLTGIVVAVRFFWVFPSMYLPRLLSKRSRERDPSPTWQSVTVIAWSGMRGIVSLAIALALPYTLGDDVFAARPGILFLTICVVFLTLVVQGVTLGPIIEWLGVSDSSKSKRAETEIRVRALEAGMSRLVQLADERHDEVDRESAGRILAEYRERIALLRGKPGSDFAHDVAEIRADRTMQREALEAERQAIVAMRRSGEIPDETYRTLEYDLDLAALRLT